MSDVQICRVHSCRGGVRAQNAHAQTDGGTHYLQRAEPKDRSMVGYDEPPLN